MTNTQTVAPLIKLAILAGGVCGLYFLWNREPSNGGESHETPAQTVISVRTSLIKQATVRQTIDVFGTVAPEPATAGKSSASASLSVITPSLVEEVDCRQGDRVEKGQPLFLLDSRAADAAVQAARKSLAAAQSNLDQITAASKLATLPVWHLLGAQLSRDLAQADLDRAIAQQAMLQVVSPLSGTVLRIGINPGEVVQPGVPAVQIVDLDRLVIDADIPAAQLPAIKLGQSVEIMPEARQSIVNSLAATMPTTAPASTMPSTILGTVTIIDPQVDPRSGMGSIDISLPVGSNFRPGEFVRVKIILQEHRDVLSVPAESIVTTSDGKTLIDLVYKDFAFPTPVHMGLREGDVVEIQGENLRPDQTVVTSGSYGIINKTQLRVLEE